MNLSLVYFAQPGINPLWEAITPSLRQWRQPGHHSLTFNPALDLIHSKSELVLENALLHQELLVLQ